MPDTGCGQSRCCFSDTDQISACWHWSEIVGFTYDEEMSPPHHDACWTGISLDPGESDQAGCRNCDIGCDGFEDDLGNLFLSALWVDGVSYLRSQIDVQHGRDAKNRVFDLLTNTPTLIQRQCKLEHGSCYENNPNPLGSGYGGYVCWGHHVCQCTPEPETLSPPCDGVPGGYPVYGLTPVDFFFNYQGWPPYGRGTSPHNELFCRKWLPANSNASPRNAPIRPYTQGKGGVYNATFLRSREGLNVDVLVPCAGIIASTSCIHTSGSQMNDDCTYAGKHRVDELLGAWINQTQPSSQSKFEDMWIVLDPEDKIGLRSDIAVLSPQQLREHQLYEDVFAAMFDQVFPHPNPPPSTLEINRVDMPASGDSNDDLGHYERTWDGTQFAESELPIIIRFPWCYTRWGRVPLVAQMVITYCKIVVNLTVPHFARYVPPGPADHWIKPFATVEIRVHTAMQCQMMPTGITVGGELVTLTNPTWGAEVGGGYDGIPTVTPKGNEIIYAIERGAPVRPFRKWRWFGRLGSFSDPATTVNPEYPDFDHANMNCEDLIDAIGTFTVPALATANESKPDDPNRNYAGSIGFHFSHQA